MSESLMERLLVAIRKSLIWNSSPVDWCEPNYATTTSIAEFYNVASNIIFLVIPPLLIYLFQPYGKRVSKNIHVIWLMMIVVGISSMYFHGTLSLAGQMFDEIGILWVLNATIAFWWPRWLLPHWLRNTEYRFEKLLLLVTVVMTALGFVWPIINAFVLMICSIPLTSIAIMKIRTCANKDAKVMAKRSLVLWLVAFTVWVSDRFFCGVWLRAGIPGGHFIWHVLSCICSYQIGVFMAFMEAGSMQYDANPVLAFWPSDDWTILGVPYIRFTSPLLLGHSKSDVTNHCQLNNLNYCASYIDDIPYLVGNIRGTVKLL